MKYLTTGNIIYSDQQMKMLDSSNMAVLVENGKILLRNK